MNWVIRSTEKVQFHTNLKEVLKPIWADLIHHRWILTDLDFMSDQPLPINFDEDFFDLDHKEFEQIYQSNTQIIWGIISAVPNQMETDTSLLSKLSAEDIHVWKSDYFSIQEGILEIIAFDSGYTLVKFKDEKLSNTFKEYFQEQAMDLNQFNAKYIR